MLVYNTFQIMNADQERWCRWVGAWANLRFVSHHEWQRREEQEIKVPRQRKGACRVRGGPTYRHRVAAGKRLHCAWATTRERPFQNYIVVENQSF
jgi:hypothetical protein